MFRLAPDIAPARPAEPAAARPGDVLVVEAATAELALGEVSAKLGERAEILGAEKVRRGGVMGFFAQEVCRVTVRVPGGQAGATAEVAVTAPRADDEPLAGIDDVLARLTAAAEAAEDGDFAAVLRRRMADEPAQRAAAASQVAQAAQVAQLKELLRDLPIADELPAEVEDAPGRADDGADADAAPRAPRIGWTRDPAAAPGTGPVRWSAGDLARLGIPAALIEATESQEPVDDTGWLVALAAAVAPYCRPLPAGDMVVAGPRAEALAPALGLELVEVGAEPPAGSFATAVRDTAEGLLWLRRLRRTRPVHAVLGGTGWDGLLAEEPLVVSWVGDDWLPIALQHCAAAGTVLGYGTVGAYGQPLRANPVDVALSVRALLPRR